MIEHESLPLDGQNDEDWDSPPSYNRSSQGAMGGSRMARAGQSLFGLREAERFMAERRSSKDGQLYQLDIIPAGITPEDFVRRLGPGIFRLTPIDADDEPIGDPIPFNIEPDHYFLRGVESGPGSSPGAAARGPDPMQALLDMLAKEREALAAREATLDQRKADLDADALALQTLMAEAGQKTTETLLSNENARNQVLVSQLRESFTGLTTTLVAALSEQNKAQAAFAKETIEQQREWAAAQREEERAREEARREREREERAAELQREREFREREQARMDALEARQAALEELKLKGEQELRKERLGLQQAQLDAKMAEIEKGSPLGNLAEFARFKEELKELGIGGGEDKSWVAEIRETVVEGFKLYQEAKNLELKRQVLAQGIAHEAPDEEDYDDEEDEDYEDAPQQQPRALPAPNAYVEPIAETALQPLNPGWVYVRMGDQGLVPVLERHVSGDAQVVYAPNDPRSTGQPVPVPAQAAQPQADTAFQEAPQAPARPAPAQPTAPTFPLSSKLRKWNEAQLFPQVVKAIKAAPTEEDAAATVAGAIAEYHKQLIPYVQAVGVRGALTKAGCDPKIADLIVQKLQEPAQVALFRAGLLKDYRLTPEQIRWA